MSRHADRYPASMTECERVGMSGNCGLDCPVYLRGDCEEPPEEEQEVEE